MINPITADDVVQVLDDEIERPDLVALLNERWHKKLTLMAAPGGYGKTRALAQAIRSNEDDPVGVEFYVRCRSAHADPVRLTNAILGALGAEAERDPDEATLADRVIDELTLLSPTNVVLILDDVHVLATSQPTVELLVAITRELPTNSHVVLIGRSIPELPLARLRAEDAVVEIAQSDLVFGTDEVADLAERHGVQRAVLDELAGWPALLRLAVVAGKAGPQNFLMQEIVDDLAPEVVRGLTVAALAGSADQALLRESGVEITIGELADRVPMLDMLATDEVQPHDLWSELAPELVEPADLQHLVRAAATWHSQAGRHDEAIMLATEYGEPETARSALMHALGGTDVSLQAASTSRWLDLFGGSASIADDDADLLLLRGWHARLEHGPGHGDDDVSAALELFHVRGDARGEAYASVESAFRGYMAGDVARIADSVQRGPRLVDAGMEFLRTLGDMTAAVVADINGDFARALEHSMLAIGPSVRAEFVELGLRHRATLQFLVGDSDAAVATTAELAEFAPSFLNQNTHLAAKFAAGDIGELVEQWPQVRYRETGNKRDDFIHGVKSIFIDACLGLTPSLEPIRSVSWERPRERFQQVLCEWSAELIAGNEEQANATLADQIRELGLDNPMIAGDVRRWLISGYIASPEARAYLEEFADTDGFGPYQERLLGLARLLHGLRAGEPVDWTAYRDPTHTIASMSLPWSVEIACGLVLHDEPLGLELADALFTYTGARPQRWLRSLAESQAAVAPGARRLLAILPAPPLSPTVVRTQHSVALVRDGHQDEVGRLRVRQLLLLLALRGSMRRDVAMTMLWPDKEVDKARNNLRITLTHLRADLEPDRRPGEPSFHLRQRGDDIVLRRSGHLHIDLWDILDSLEAAEAAGRSGDRSARLQALLPVAEGWQPPLFVDLIDIVDARAEVEALQAQLVDVTVEVAETCVSSGDYEAAERLAQKLLVHDRYHERAHAALIASHLGGGRTSQAHRAIDECLAALVELGVQPSPATRMLMRRAQFPDEANRRTA